MKIDRLISIIMVLLERKKISASKLADMFEVTTRTIYRDIEALNLAGIPIITYPGINGGIGIIEDYKIDKKLFTNADITTLLMGLGSISSTLSNEEIVNTLAKVKGLIPAEQIREIELKSSQISIDLTPWSGNRSFQPNIEEIKRALEENKFISFDYSDREGNKTKRIVEPYQLVLKESKWYLQGFCTTKSDYRVFKLSRISQVTVSEEGFIPRQFNARPLRKPDGIELRMISVQLLIDEFLKEKMLEMCGEEYIEPCGCNKYIVSFPFLESDFGYNLILSFGDKCECIGPPEVRNELISRINKLSALYHK